MRTISTVPARRLLALALTTALTLGVSVAQATPNDREAPRGREDRAEPAARPAAPPAAQNPGPSAPRFEPRGPGTAGPPAQFAQPQGGPVGRAPFDGGARGPAPFAGGRPFDRNVGVRPFDRGQPRGEQGFVGNQPDRGRPGFVGDQPDRGRPGFAGDRRGYDGGRQGIVQDPNQPTSRFADTNRPGFDRGRGGVDGRPGDPRQAFVGGGGRGGEVRHIDRAREDSHERREWEHEGGFRGGDHDFEHHRHDYQYHDWHRDNDENRLLIINRYGYSPWGYGFRPGWTNYGLGSWGGNVGWGFDLRFGYWYGPSYYNPGYDWWYGSRTPYQYGVRADELILRESVIRDWALYWYDYNRDGYLDRDEVRAAGRALRQQFDYDGNGWIDAREYRSALNRLGGRDDRGYAGYDDRGYADEDRGPY